MADSPEHALLSAAQRAALAAAGAHIRGLPPTAYARTLLAGKAPACACAADPRASFTVYAPAIHDFSDAAQALPVVVSVHGMARDMRLVDKMGPFAEKHGVLVVAPLFPCGIEDLADIHNYKALRYRSIRYDLLVLSILEQLAYTYRVRTDRFYLHGFSGGGQFVHRFLYAHAPRLLGVSVGAPGQVTLPDDALPWPHGVRDIADVLGAPIDWEALRAVPVHFVIGEKDTAPLPGARGGEQEPEEARTGRTRQDKIRALRDALKAKGVVGRLVRVPGVGHAGLKCLEPVHEFLGALIEEAQAGGAGTGA